jgi:type I restriction enzyme R subunit
MIDYREIKFEEAIEHHLIHHGYTKADSKNFDRSLALDPTVLLPFVRETQPAKWKVIADYHAKNAETVFLEEVTRAMDARGSLDVLATASISSARTSRSPSSVPPIA